MNTSSVVFNQSYDSCDVNLSLTIICFSLMPYPTAQERKN